MVIPCHNEAEHLPEVLTRTRNAVEGLVSALRIVIVDDGSTDETPLLVEGLAAEATGISYVRLSRNFGKEAALVAGLREAAQDLVVVMDGDLQHPPELLPTLLEVQRESGADQVVAVRSRGGEGFARRIWSTAYGKLLARSTDVELPEGHGDFRLVTSRVVDAVLELSEVTRFNRGLFAWVGFSTVDVEFDDAPRGRGESKWSAGALVGYGVDGLLSFSPRPLRFLIVGGAMAMAVFMAYVLFVIVRVAIWGVEAPGYATLIAAVFFVGGVQAFSVGILGEYLGRIFLEVKRRPPFIVERRHGPSGSSSE